MRWLREVRRTRGRACARHENVKSTMPAPRVARVRPSLLRTQRFSKRCVIFPLTRAMGTRPWARSVRPHQQRAISGACMSIASRRHIPLIVFAIVAALATPTSAMAQAPRGKIVLYTSQPERDASQTVAAYRKSYPDVEVEVFLFGHHRDHGQAHGRTLGRAAQGRRAADRRCRQHGSAEKRRTAARLSAGERQWSRRRHV